MSHARHCRSYVVNQCIELSLEILKGTAWTTFSTCLADLQGGGAPPGQQNVMTSAFNGPSFMSDGMKSLPRMAGMARHMSELYAIFATEVIQDIQRTLDLHLRLGLDL